MRYLMLACLLTTAAAPAAALNPPVAPQPATRVQPQPVQPMRELPADFLENADLDSTADGDITAGAEGTDQLAGGNRGPRSADLGRECRETSGTTGLILGAVAGGILGNVIDGGGKRTAGTLLGAGGGALLGREIEKKRAAAGCR